MRLVLDSNVYILGFSESRPPAAASLFGLLVDEPDRFELIISRTILQEVEQNLPPRAYGVCWGFLTAMDIEPVESWQIPFETGSRYQERGLKPGDAFIAALAEWSGAEYLVTENRHFMVRSALPFKVAKIEDFLRVAEKR